MRKALPLWLLLSLCGSFTSIGMCAAPSVVPSSESAAQLEPGSNADKRLDQKITYDARRKTVLTILTDLSKISGVTLKAGRSDSDWQVRDRKMNVFVKNLSVLTVMNSMARTMKFTWTKSKSDPLAYRMYADPRALSDAEKQANGDEQQFEAKQAKKREALVANIHAVANNS